MKLPLKVLVLILLVLVVVGAGYYFLSKKGIVQKPQEVQIADAIAKVGDEYLYAKDLEVELSVMPPSIATSGAEIKQQVLKKMVDDSIIIQQALKDKIASSSAETFNSADKDYFKRIILVSDIRDRLKIQSDGIAGTVVSIWFFNGRLGKLSYEQAQKLAMDKITKLHQDVKDGKLTIEQAGEAIKNDSSLSQIDPSYKTNAIYQFDVNSAEKISKDKDFDQLLWKLKQGEVSEIFTGVVQEQKTKTFIKTNYKFAQLTKNKQTGQIADFDSWLDESRNKYEVTYF